MKPVVQIVTTGEALARLAEPWWALWRQSPHATPFQSPAWLIPWWQSFQPGVLHTIAVWNGPSLSALAPFYVEQGERRRRLLPLGISVSDHLDVLIAPAGAEEHAAALAEAIAAVSVDECALEELRSEACGWQIPCPCTLSCVAAPESACPVLTLSGGLDLAGCVPARRRRQLRRAHVAALRRGAVEIQPIRRGEEEHFLAQLTRLHGLRWQSQGEPGVMCDPRVRRFHAAALPELTAAGLSRCSVLRIGEAVAAAYYGLAGRRCHYGYLGGFDPAFAAESPGSILIGHAIAQAIGEAAAEFDFLRGQEDYKYSWGAADRWNHRRSLLRTAAA